MSKNSIREKPEEPKQEAPKKKRNSKSARKFLRFMRVFGIFNRQQVVRMMPFILFITVILLFYIGNSYYAERTIRKINQVKKELKDKRAEYISTSSELMFRTKQSEVARAISSMEIRESTEPQKKITKTAAEKAE